MTQNSTFFSSCNRHNNFGDIRNNVWNKKTSAPRPLNDTGRSLISETFSLEGTLRTSGAIDIAGLIKVQFSQTI